MAEPCRRARPTRTRQAARRHRLRLLRACWRHDERRGTGYQNCGINPGLYTAATGHHFARPGNRFWPTLYAAGFTDRLLDPSEERLLLDRGYGITNVVPRTTATAVELSAEELVAGGQALEAKVRRWRPRALAVLGVTAYRAAFDRPRAALGLQPDRIDDTIVWVLPNPSGLNAHYQRDALAALFGELRAFLSNA